MGRRCRRTSDPARVLSLQARDVSPRIRFTSRSTRDRVEPMRRTLALLGVGLTAFAAAFAATRHWNAPPPRRPAWSGFPAASSRWAPTRIGLARREAGPPGSRGRVLDGPDRSDQRPVPRVRRGDRLCDDGREAAGAGGDHEPVAARHAAAAAGEAGPRLAGLHPARGPG